VCPLSTRGGGPSAANGRAERYASNTQPTSKSDTSPAAPAPALAPTPAASNAAAVSAGAPSAARRCCSTCANARCHAPVSPRAASVRHAHTCAPRPSAPLAATEGGERERRRMGDGRGGGSPQAALPTGARCCCCCCRRRLLCRDPPLQPAPRWRRHPAPTCRRISSHDILLGACLVTPRHATPGLPPPLSSPHGLDTPQQSLLPPAPTHAVLKCWGNRSCPHAVLPDPHSVVPRRQQNVRFLLPARCPASQQRTPEREWLPRRPA